MKEKITKVLEKAPAGLSISEIAEKAGLHRNTVSNLIADLMEEDIVRMRKLGNAKVFYLTKYAGLHEHELGYKGENISVGLGVGDLEDGYKAAVSASKQAVNQACPGEEPSFSLVFVSSRYNEQVEEVVKALNSILGENWIGCTTDREINSILGYCEGTINVLAIRTDHMYFGVGVSEEYRKNPKEEGKKATLQAIENCPVERSKYATAQFLRGTSHKFAEIIRKPPYFILTLVGGVYYQNHQPILGMECEFLEGIREVVGPYTPIIGASASSDFDKVALFEGENYVFANGNIYKGGAVVVFAVTNLYFSYSLEHGFKLTNKALIVTDIDNTGHIIKELNSKAPVDEYAKFLNVDQKELVNHFFEYSLYNPLGIIDEEGNSYIASVGLNPDKKTFYSLRKLLKNTTLYIFEYNEEDCIDAVKNALEQAKKDTKGNIAFALLFSCSARRSILKDKVAKVYERIKNELAHTNLVGFYSFGEIGAKLGGYSRYNNQTATILIILDKLITEHE